MRLFLIGCLLLSLLVSEGCRFALRDFESKVGSMESEVSTK